MEDYIGNIFNIFLEGFVGNEYELNRVDKLIIACRKHNDKIEEVMNFELDDYDKFILLQPIIKKCVKTLHPHDLRRISKISSKLYIDILNYPIFTTIYEYLDNELIIFNREQFNAMCGICGRCMKNN